MYDYQAGGPIPQATRREGTWLATPAPRNHPSFTTHLNRTDYYTHNRQRSTAILLTACSPPVLLHSTIDPRIPVSPHPDPFRSPSNPLDSSMNFMFAWLTLTLRCLNQSASVVYPRLVSDSRPPPDPPTCYLVDRNHQPPIAS